MAKKHKEFIAYGQMTKKAKFVNFMKIFGIAFGAVVALVAGITLYVFLTGGFNPPFVPLETMTFSQSEYVIDKNKTIKLDENNNQIYDEDGNIELVQSTDANGNPVYDYVMLVPNEGCTEFDATIKLTNSANLDHPIVQLVEDENVVAIGKTEEDEEGTTYERYSVKINSPIYIKPTTITNGDEETTLSGWIKLEAEHEMITTSCWVFVDTPIENLSISLNNSEEYDFESEMVNGKEDVTYNVFPNSQIKIGNQILPTESQTLPKSNVPSSTTTSFNFDKKIQYQVSDPEIASIDANGNVTIKPNKEGQTFYVYAYVISRYKDITSETYSFNKSTCIISNIIKFKINEISVAEITTLKQGASRVSYDYPVFQSGTIQYSNDSSKTVQRNDFYVDLILTNSADDSFKSELYNKIKIYVCAEGEIATEQDEYDQLDDIRDLIVNGHLVEDASLYFTFDATTKRYVVNQYSSNTFYFVFYYEMEDKILYDYIPFNITKVAVSNITLKNNAINLNYEEEDGENASQTYSLTNDNFATVTPSNSTYNQILYFVCDTESNDQIVDVDSLLYVKINEKNFYAVRYTNNDSYDYGTLKPIYYGRTLLYAVVVRTLPASLLDANENYAGQFETIEIGGKTVNILKTNDGVEFEYYSAPITLTISKDVQFTTIDEYFGNDEDIYNKSDKVMVYVTPEDAEEYAKYNTSNDIYAEINQGGELAIEIIHSGTPIDLEGDKLQIVYAQDADQSIASISKVNNTHSGVYYFSILANQVGSTQFQIIYTGSKGQVSLRTIGIKVLSTQLVEIDLDSSQKNIEVEFVTEPIENADEYGDIKYNATGFNWKSIELELSFKSPDTEAKDFELVTYALPDDFDTSILSKYQGKQFEEIIEDSALNSTNNSIQKLLAGLTLSDECIVVNNNYQLNPQDKSAPNMIYITVGNNVYAFSFTFKKLGSVLLFAQSTSTSICSNPVLINITIPEITVEYGNPNETTKTVMAYGNKQDKGLMSIDNHITNSSEVNLYLDGDDKILFTVEADEDTKINISDLMKFKFERQTESVMGDTKFTSTRSGATITNKSTLTVFETSSEITENIIAYSDFGYFNEEFYTYIISPDYKLTTNTTETYLTPTYLDLFEGEKITITNKQFDGTLSVGNKLYLPEGYASNIDELKTKLNPSFLEKFFYADSEGNEYYHIYCNITINETSMDDYIVNGQRIKVLYKQSEGSIFVYFSTPANFQLSSKINIAPGISTAFENGGGDIIASNWSADEIVNLSDRFNFVQNTPYVLTADEEIDESKTYYIKNNGNEYIKVDNPDESYLSIYYEQVDMFSVLVDSLSTTTTSQTSDNLKFFNIDNNIVIVLFNPYEDYNFSSIPIFNKTTDTELVDGKKYYYENGSLVAEPVQNDLGLYYEIANHYFIKTQDDVLDNAKTYYKLVNNAFEAIEESNLDEDEKDSYYELVYSNEDYYKMVEAYYLPISPEQVHENYKSKYYEQLTKYRKATGSFDTEKTYYIQENGQYVEVEKSSASAENMNNYYEQYFDYSPVSTYSENKTYYYRYDHQKVENGGDITGAFRKITITIAKTQLQKTSDSAVDSEKTYYKLVNGEFEVVENPDDSEIGSYYESVDGYRFYVFASEGIEELSTTINLTLKLNLKITNLANNCEVTYSNFTYALRFIEV